VTITCQNVIDRVRAITGDRTAAIYADVDIIRWINDAQLRVLKSTETAQKDVTGTSAIGQWQYVIAGGFLMVRDVKYGGQQLQAITREKLNLLDPNWSQNPTGMLGTPDYYWLQKDTVNLYVTPDTAGFNVVVTLVPRPVVLTVVGDSLVVPDESIEAIVNLCLEDAKTWDEDWQGAAYFRDAAKQRMAEDAYLVDVPTIDSYPTIRSMPGDDW